MIENEEGLQVAEKWIEYWKSTRSAAQSWIGNEQAGQKIAELKAEINAYRKRQAGIVRPEPESNPGAETRAGLPA